MLWKLAIIFGIYLLVDIFGHICFKIKRNRIDRILLVGVIMGTCITIMMGLIEDYGEKMDYGSSLYMAYRYLEEGDVSRACVKISETGGSYKVKAEVLGIFADVMEENYIEGYFRAEQLIEDVSVGHDDKKYLRKLRDICNQALGMDRAENVLNNMMEINEEDKDGQAQYYLDLISLGSNGYDKNEDRDENTNKNEQNYSYRDNYDIISLLEEYFKTIRLSDRQIRKYSKEYEIDRELYQMDIESITESDIEQIKNKYGDEETVLIFTCRYYAYNGQYDEALKVAQKLMDKQDNEKSFVIYSDIIAQQEYEIYGSDNKGRYYKNTYDAIEEIKRRIPSYGDITGMYELQLAKLYFVRGDTEEADKYIYSMMENSADIDDDSIIKHQLGEVVKQYMKGSEEKGALLQSISNLIIEQSSNVVPLKEGSINREFMEYMLNKLKKDKEAGKTDKEFEWLLAADEKLHVTNKEDHGKIEPFEEKGIGITAISDSKLSVSAVYIGTDISITGYGFEDIQMNEEEYQVYVGNYPLDNVVTEEGVIHGVLKDSLESGNYDVIIRKNDESTIVTNGSIIVYDTGSIETMKLGNTVIMSDNISEKENGYLADGNVVINGCIYAKGDISVEIMDMNPEIMLGERPYVVGKTGFLKGNQELYISFAGREVQGIEGTIHNGGSHILCDKEFVINVEENGMRFE